MSENLPAVHSPPTNTRALSAFSSIASFEDAQRMAKALAASAMVPKDYQGRMENCLIALEVAQRTGSSPFAVMQSLDVIHGRPSWRSTYIIGAINSCGRFSALRFKLEPLGQKTVSNVSINDMRCMALATDLETGEVVEGPPVTVEMAVKEGWYTKQGSKWQTMPELMIQYRAAAFFGRLYCPDLLLGMQTDDEIRDVTPTGASAERATDTSAPAAVRKVNERVKTKMKKGPVIDAQAVDITAAAGGPVDSTDNGQNGEFF